MTVTMFIVRYTTSAEVAVRLDAHDADDAEDSAWQIAEDYLNTLLPDGRGASITISLDGIGADTIEETR